MQYRQLGSAGVRVSTIGLGTNQFGGKVDARGVDALLGRAVELGVTFVDTADIYQRGRSEETIGAALTGTRRRQLFLATKVGMRTDDGPNGVGASRQRILDGIDGSLARLKTDYVDLYQIHQWDEDTPLEETLQALDDVVRRGKARYVGASNFAAWQLAQANLVAEMGGLTPFATIQPHWHLFERDVEREMVPYCESDGVGIIPYFPLAGGVLTGKYRRGEPVPDGSRGATSKYVKGYLTEANYARLEKLEAFAGERRRSLTELAVAWLLRHELVASVIAGATAPDHLDASASAHDWELDDDELAAIETILE